MEEDLKVLERLKARFEEEYPYCNIWGNEIQAIENLIKGYKELKDKNNNVSDRLEYYLIDNFAIMENPNKVKEEFERLLNMLQEGDK